MSQRTALVFGSSGLVGSCLTQELIKSEEYSLIKLFSRRETEFARLPKIENVITDFAEFQHIVPHITGDDIFICMGTTIKKAGSVKKMEEIDRDLPVRIARAAYDNGVRKIAVVSSIGASEASSNYYLRIKGEMEKGIAEIDFETTVIVRPSLLLGTRREKRFAESVSKFFMKIFGIFLTGNFKKFRAIEGRNVAIAMLKLINTESGKGVFESNQLQNIADKKQ